MGSHKKYSLTENRDIISYTHFIAQHKPISNKMNEGSENATQFISNYLQQKRSSSLSKSFPSHKPDLSPYS